MKWILFIFIFSAQVFAYEETVEEKTALNTLFIKMGITSLTKDFELEKENILQNTNDIEELKKQVQYLLQENMKLKLQVKETGIGDENISIQKEVKKTPKKQLKQISYKNSDDSILRKAVISLTSASIIETPYPNSKTIAILNKDDLIKIRSCDKYGWCKLYERDGYIAMYKLRFLP